MGQPYRPPLGIRTAYCIDLVVGTRRDCANEGTVTPLPAARGPLNVGRDCGPDRRVDAEPAAAKKPRSCRNSHALRRFVNHSPTNRGGDGEGPGPRGTDRHTGRPPTNEALAHARMGRC
jgi:hypothetical protein